MKTTLVILFATLISAISSNSVEIRYFGEAPEQSSILESEIAKTPFSLTDSTKQKQLLISLQLKLQQEGYLDAIAEYANDTVTIDAGAQYSVSLIRVHDSTSKVTKLKVPFTKNNTEALLSEEADRLSAKGFYFATATVTSVVKRESSVELDVSINRGPLVKVSSSRYVGLDKTNAILIERYLGIPKGDTLSEESIKELERRAVAIPFITFKPPIVVRPRAGYTEADLEYIFVERRPVSIFGGGGYLPDDPSGLVWNLDLRLRNIFGDGREVSVVSDRRASSRSNFRVAYSQPLFWLGLGQIESFISTRNYKNEFYEFALETNYRTTIKEDLFGGAGISVRRVEPVSGVDRYVRFQGDFRFEGRGLDVMRNPGRGFVFDWTLSYIHRKYDKRLIDTLRNDGSSFNDTRATFSADLYQPIAGKFRAHIGADYMGFETAEKLPPLSEMIPLGGPGSLRGYRSEQFFVQRSVFGTVEPRLRFENGTLFTFIDAAYLNRPILETRTAAGSVITEELFRYSYGVGISLLTEERSLMLSLGWNPELRLSQPQVSIELSSDL